MFLRLLDTSEVVETEISGIDLKILPGVFSPNIFFESQWFAEKIAKISQDKSLLEIGPGSGIVSLFASINGASVTAIDINENAVKNTRLNFDTHNLNIDVRLGSVYNPLKSSEEFDVIFWNHPFNNTSQKDNEPLLQSVFDYQYKHLEEYISSGVKYLSKDGQLLLGTSNIANLEEIEAIARKYNYKFGLIDQIEARTEIDGSATDFRIYRFSPISH